jgi:hypothetical protein
LSFDPRTDCRRAHGLPEHPDARGQFESLFKGDWKSARQRKARKANAAESKSCLVKA